MYCRKQTVTMLSTVLETAPTVVDAVDTVGEQFFQRRSCHDIWQLLKTSLILLLSIVEVVVGLLGLEEFRQQVNEALHHGNKLLELELAQALGYSLLPAFQLSVVIHGVCVLHHQWFRKLITKCYENCLHPFTTNDLQEDKTCNTNDPQEDTTHTRRLFYWQSVNSVCLMLCESTVSVSKILIAFESQEAEDSLRTPLELQASIITLTVATFDLLLTLILLIQTLWTKVKCCTGMLCWNLFLLIMVALEFSAALLSFLISMGEFEVDQDKPMDFLVNLSWLLGIPVGVLIFFPSIFALVICCIRKYCKNCCTCQCCS